MKRTVLIFSVLVSVPMLFAVPAFAAPDILVEAVTMNVSPGGAVGSVFMVITNRGDEDDTLVSCALKDAPSARCELHNVAEGKMYPVEEIKVGAGKTVLLQKGSYHIMIFDLPGVPEDKRPRQLTFKKSGTLEAESTIRQAQPMMMGGGQ